jgi:hypothetical protein
MVFMKYNTLPQTQQIDVLIPDHTGLQAVGNGPPLQFNSDLALLVRNYGVPIGSHPRPLPAMANRHEITSQVVPAEAACINNLLSCACVVYIYTIAGGAVTEVVVYHAHTGMIRDTALPIGSAFDPGGVAAADVHVVFASAESMNANQPMSGIQSASSGLHTLVTAGIPQGNIRVLTGCPSTFGANVHGDVGMSPVPGFLGNDLPARVTTALVTAGATAFPSPAMDHARQALQLTLHASQNLPHGLVRDTAVNNALRSFCGQIPASTYQPRSFAVAFARELEHQILGVATATHINAQVRLTAALDAIAVGVRQL